MTVADLRKVLGSLPDEMPVLVYKDVEEGLESCDELVVEHEGESVLMLY